MIEIFRKYLEIKNLSELKNAKKPHILCKITHVTPPDLQLNKFFYKQIGNNHRWIDRLSWTDATWINYLNNQNVKTFIIKKDGDLAGYYEIIYNEKSNEHEIAYFGILHEYRNKGFGGYLLSDAIKRSLNNNSNRVWVHTCSLDHKDAIKNYLARGMVVFKEEKIKIPA